MIRVLLYEDNKNYREALIDAFEDSDKVFLTKAYPNALKAVRQIKEIQPDVVLMDIEMPGISGLDALAQINEQCPGTKVLMQTQFEDNHRIFVALCRGALGYAIKKDPFDRLEEAIVEVHNGGGYFSPIIAGKVARFFQSQAVKKNPDYTPLTPKETEVLGYLAKAKKYKEIAALMHISYAGVHSHVKNIYKKLHVSSRAEAVMKAIENKLI